MGVLTDAIRTFFNTILKVLEHFFKDEEWWNEVEEALVIAIMMAELNEDSSEEKKEAVINKVIEYLIDLGIIKDTWRWWVEMLLGWAINAIIRFVNEKYGHDWIKKIEKQEVDKFKKLNDLT